MDERNFQEIEGSKSAVCNKCGTKDSSNYGFDSFTKKLNCYECTRSCIFNGQILQDESTLCVEYRERRVAFKELLKSVFKTIDPQAQDFGEDIDAIELVLWIDANSIEEYENISSIVQRIRKVLSETRS